MERTVLIVEDVATTRAVLRKILTTGGYRVVEAESGEVALRTYMSDRPDAVVMDVHMDQLSGIGAMQVMLRLDPNARVVICSSDADPQFILETQRLGARGYLRKPFEPAAVMQAIQDALA
jgi:two-component system chemotaxis response regulator CheY